MKPLNTGHFQLLKCSPLFRGVEEEDEKLIISKYII